MKEPAVSVVTPSLEQGRFIERTIESVLSQGVEVEYFVADGGSRDQTVDILRRYAERLRWASEPDGGQAAGVNKGVERTSAGIVGWLNSDDVYYPGALWAVQRFLAEHPEIDVVYGDAEHIDEEDRVLEAYPTEDFDAERLLEVCFIAQPACFFRRRAVERWGALDASLRYCMDYEYWLRLALGGARFARLPRVLAGSRLYTENKTLGQRRAVHREINDMMRRTVGRVPDRWLSNWAHALLEPSGLSLERTPARFTLAVSALCWLASMRWNHRVSAEMRRTTWGWIRGNVLGRTA